MKDRYDRAIEYLTENPDEICTAWRYTKDVEGGCLFMFVSETSEPARTDGGGQCGCLTQIRRGKFDAKTLELTAAIRADDRIPSSPTKIKVSDLPVFAEWQRKLDAMFPGRNPEEVIP